MLEKDLSNDLASKLLSECGYTCGNPGSCIAQLIVRLRNNPGFPHEVGLFLGYPPADVDGFMHRKHACKLSGIWKVYDDVEGASRQFARCKRCTEVYLQRYRQGYSLDKLTVTALNLLLCPENPEAAPFTMVTDDNNRIVLTFRVADGIISYVKAE